VETCGTEVIIPKTIGGVEVKIVDGIFFGGTNITSIIIPDTVTEMFFVDGGFVEMESVTIPESVTAASLPSFIVNNIFLSENTSTVLGSESKITKIVLPTGSSLMGSGYSLNGSLVDVIIMEGNTLLDYNFEKTNISSIELPSSISWVTENTFYNCENLTEIVVRGKTSLDDFEDATGLTTEGGLPEGVNIIFRP